MVKVENNLYVILRGWIRESIRVGSEIEVIGVLEGKKIYLREEEYVFL